MPRRKLNMKPKTRMTLRPLVQPKFEHARGQHIGKGLHVLTTGGPKQKNVNT